MSLSLITRIRLRFFCHFCRIVYFYIERTFMECRPMKKCILFPFLDGWTHHGIDVSGGVNQCIVLEVQHAIASIFEYKIIQSRTSRDHYTAKAK